MACVCHSPMKHDPVQPSPPCYTAVGSPMCPATMNIERSPATSSLNVPRRRGIARYDSPKEASLAARHPLAELATFQSPQCESRAGTLHTVFSCECENRARSLHAVLNCDARTPFITKLNGDRFPSSSLGLDCTPTCPGSMAIERSPMLPSTLLPHSAGLHELKLPTPLRLRVGRHECIAPCSCDDDDGGLNAYSIEAVIGKGAFGLVTRMRVLQSSELKTGVFPLP